MQYRTPTIIVGVSLVTALVVWLAFSFFGIQALWSDTVVNETVPIATVPQPDLGAVPVETTTTVGSKPIDKPATTVVPPSAPKPLTVPTMIADGVFNQGDSTYTIQGKAIVTEKDGVRTLSLADFNVTNGPDLFVYLVSAANSDNKTVKDAVGGDSFVNLGVLKGNKGNQNYVLPPEAKLDSDSVISIWCRRFFRNFGAAELKVLVE